MSVIQVILIGSVLFFPAVGLWALRWAGRNGEFSHLDRSALLPFDEQEPVGEMTDAVLHRPQPPKTEPKA